VSNALNAPQRVRPDTLSRVLASIEHLGYRPNSAARNLRTQSTRLLGCRLLPSLQMGTGGVLDRFLHALCDAARDRGYDVLSFAASTDDAELDVIDDLLRRTAVDAYVIAGTRGPLVACHEDGTGCGAQENTVWFYVFVANGNDVTNFGGASNRTTLPNSFVVDSVEWHVFIDGAPYTAFDTTFTPPPNAFVRAWSGHWPATVTCATPTDPCTNVLRPAVIPGENVAVTYAGWAHGDAEPNGKYVFEFAIHGSLNGAPLDLTARSKPIEMTD